LITRRIYLAVLDTARSDMLDWLSLDANADLYEALRHGIRLPVRLDTPGGGAGAISVWVSERDMDVLQDFIVRMPGVISASVKVSEGKTDNNPTAPTFDEWLASMGATRI
jgi:hypothetical protein